MRTAFVLGGGGVLGAVEVGMLRALFERDVTPDLVLGTSVGALNGAMVAREPSLDVIERLTEMWAATASPGSARSGPRRPRAIKPFSNRPGSAKPTAGGQETEHGELFREQPLRTVRRVVSTGGTHLYSAKPLRERLVDEFGDLRFEDLPVELGVCAASIERAAEHWFTSGPLVPAIVASAAVPGLLPPARATTEFGEEHFLDGGIVNSIPVGRAVAQGATRVFVLQVGRIDRPLAVPRRPWEVARVSFEIARRHRFMRELAEVPDGVDVHVLPAAGTSSRDDSMLAFRDFSSVQRRIDATYDASLSFLDEHLPR